MTAFITSRIDIRETSLPFFVSDQHPTMTHNAPPRLPEPRRSWYRWSFYAAAIYNLIWGTVVILAPAWTLAQVGISTDAIGLLFWQCIGMFVLVFAIGYYAAARQPERYALFLLIAVLGKIFGPIGFLYGAFYLGVLPKTLGFTIITNDLIWWPIWLPFVWETFVRPRTIDGNEQAAMDQVDVAAER